MVSGGCGVIWGTGDRNAWRAGLNTGAVEWLRKQGELGQLILGLAMGYSPEEVAEKREWDEETARKLKRDLMDLSQEEDIPRDVRELAYRSEVFHGQHKFPSKRRGIK
jgi:hypothetical protein